MKIRYMWSLCLVLILLPLWQFHAHAQSLTDESLIAGVDRVITANIKQNGVPGAVMSIVREGRIIALKGYGFADVANKIVPDPAGTVFRIASVSKPITAVAVMQLVEQGKLDLDKDVNKYLKSFRIPDTYKEPITLRHILRHTTGFDETGEYGLATYDLNHQLPLAEMMKIGLPFRIRAPGEVTQYSNYAYSLAGLIVQNVSGMPFEKYVQENIFKPLSMNNTSFLPTPDVREHMAKSYYTKNGQLELNSLINIGVRPSGSINSTAEDMAKFMLSQLNAEDGMAILKPETKKLMQSQQFYDYPGFEGYGFGLYQTAGGLEHMGSLNCFNAYMLLDPSSNVGIFIAINIGSDSFQFSIAHALKKLVIQENDALSIDMKQGAAVSSKFDGNYIGLRSPQQSFAKLFRLLPGSTTPLTVEAMGMQLRIGTVMYRPVDKDLYQSLDKSHFVYFEKDSGGRACMVTSNGMGFIGVPWHDDSLLNGIMLVFFFVLFLSIFITRLFVRKRYRKTGKINKDKPGAFVTAFFLGSTLFLVLLFFVSANYFDFIRSILPHQAMLFFSNLSAMGLLFSMSVMVINAVKKKYGPISRIGSTIYVMTGCAYLLFLSNWNLIGWKLY